MSEGEIDLPEGHLKHLGDTRYKLPLKLKVDYLRDLSGKAKRNKIHNLNRKLKRRAIKAGKAEGESLYLLNAIIRSIFTETRRRLAITRDAILDHSLLTHFAGHRRNLDVDYQNKTFRVGDDKSIELQKRDGNTKQG